MLDAGTNSTVVVEYELKPADRAMDVEVQVSRDPGVLLAGTDMNAVIVAHPELNRTHVHLPGVGTYILRVVLPTRGQRNLSNVSEGRGNVDEESWLSIRLV